MSAPNPTRGGYEIVATYQQTKEEIAWCAKAKSDAIARGRKCFVNIPTSGTQKGLLCLWLLKKDILKGESAVKAGKKKYQPGAVVLKAKDRTNIN